MYPSTIVPRTPARWLASALLLCTLAACASWDTQEVSPQVLAGEHPPEKLRVAISDHTWVVLRHPAIAHDSVYGVIEVGMYEGQWLRGGGYTGIPLDSVRDLAVAADPQDRSPLAWQVASLFSLVDVLLTAIARSN